ncbi:MAG TPA: ubiquinol-cytochrome C chaperone family protein [Alphaproteobacteria bacterium]|nr:ubiquinol-cytochrome C chaperone family protein [Alphaproteobacteria bacterium]
MRAEAGLLYGQLAGQARLATFYTSLGVPDSIDGRFEMLCIHAHALFHQLRGQGAAADQLAQAVYDAMFLDLDGSLRELGVADLGVGRRIKVMTEALKGRIQAYDAALAATGPEAEEQLRDAIRRNVYGTVDPAPDQVAAMAGYLRALRTALAGAGFADLAAGRLRFPQPPEESRDAPS